MVAAINGHCLGGGLELAVRCDLRICAAAAKLGMPPAKLGLIYSPHRARAVHRRRRRRRAPASSSSPGATSSAERAERIGLVNDASTTTRSRRAALELAAEIAANAPLSMTGNKRAIEELARAARLDPEKERELIELRRSCFASEDFREGIPAFAEKRKPRWKGR